MHVLPKKYLTDRVQLSENPWREKKSGTHIMSQRFYGTKDPGMNLAIPSLEGNVCQVLIYGLIQRPTLQEEAGALP